MKKRLLTALIALPLLAPFLIFSGGWPLIVLIVSVSLIAVYELLKCTGNLKRVCIVIPSVLVTLAASLLHIAIRCGVMSVEQYFIVMMLSYVVYFTLMMTVAVFSKGTVKLTNVCQLSVMTTYVSFGFATLILLRDCNKDFGMILFLFAVIIPWVCDAAAYFVGVFFGKHKLIPDVSPKKTIEGAIGGIVGGVLITAIFGLIMQFGFGKVPNYFVLLTMAFVACIVSQFGDLIASLFKREFGLKDYSNIFPGHGGIMDRCDSIFTVSVFTYVVYKIFEQYPLFIVW